MKLRYGNAMPGIVKLGFGGVLPPRVMVLYGPGDVVFSGVLVSYGMVR